MRKNWKKRLLSLILILVLCIGLLPIGVKAANLTGKSGDYTLTLTAFSYEGSLGKHSDALSKVKWIRVSDKREEAPEGYIQFYVLVSYEISSISRAEGFTIRVPEKACDESIDVMLENVEYEYVGEHVVASFHVTRPVIAHTTDTPECLGPGTCSVCGKPASKPCTFRWNSDGTKHWQQCKDNYQHRINEGTCSGGTATCAARAKCSTCGYNYGTKPPHDLRYSLQEGTTNVAVETCANCSHNATATLSAKSSSYTYTGKAIEGGKLSYDLLWEGKEDRSCAYSDHTDAGIATVTANACGVELRTTFEILPAELTADMAALSATSGAYTGAEQKPTCAVAFNGKSMMEGTDYTTAWSGDVITPGDYTLTVTGMKNLYGSVTLSYKIIKGFPTAEMFVMIPPDPSVYDGTAHYAAVEPAAWITGMGEITVRHNGMEEPVNAGNYTVTIDVAESEYYEPVYGLRVGDFTVDQAENVWVTAPAVEDWTYGDAPNAPVGEARFGECKVTYSGWANDETPYNSETAPTKAGSYMAIFTVEETGNYTGLETSVEFTVEKASYDMTSAKWDYTEPFAGDGAEKSVALVGLPEGVTVGAYLGNTAAESGSYTAAAVLLYDECNYIKPAVPELNWWIKPVTDTENTEKVKDITAENVTPEDREALENAKKDLEALVEEFGEAFSEEEQNTIKEETERIGDALAALEKAEVVEELIDRLPETVTKDDREAIEAADEAYNALSDHERSIVDEERKAALDAAKKALAALSSPSAVPVSPATGDGSKPLPWLILLLISGAGIAALLLGMRKKRGGKVK